MSIIERVTAYVDESLRLGGEGRYVLAAVVVPADRAAEVRATLRSALRPGQRRIHWRDESAPSRDAAVRLLADLGLAAVVVTAVPVARDRQERARRRCLPTLLWELDQRGVTDVVLESRQHRDAEDDRMIGYARRSGWVSRRLRYEFAKPADECLLWLADVLAGAGAADLADGQHRHLAALGDVAVVTAP